MKNVPSLTVALGCLLLTACHRPVAYFQRSPHAPADRLTVAAPPAQSAETTNDRIPEAVPASAEPLVPVLASTATPVAISSTQRVHRHLARISAMRPAEATAPVDQWQPKPKPKPKMRLGNKIRDALGMPLREELNWWQRISWKLKASVIVILIAVLFAILHVTILAIIFGLVGAFLLLSGLRRSFKVRRPWF